MNPGSARLTAFAMLGTALAAVVLISVIQGGPWFWQSLGAAGLVGALGVAGRRLGLPRPPTATGQLAALAAYLTWLFVREPAVAGVYPGPAAVHAFHQLVSSGLADIRNSAAPAPATPGLMLIAVAGIGLMALLVDLVAVAYRRTALAGLPLLAIYTVPAAVLPDGVNAVLFLFPAAGFLGILLAEGRERVLRWGLPLIASERDARAASTVVVSVSSAELNQLGRRIGVAALGLAVVVPAVLPGISDGVFGAGGGTEDGIGSNRTIATLNALVTLRRDLTRSDDITVMRIRTDAPSPGDLYFRTATLDVFDGQDWRASTRRVQRFDKQLPAAEGLSPQVASRTIHSSVQVSRQLQSDYLPMPYPASRLSIRGDWRVDPDTQNVVSHRGRRQISGREYSVDSLLLSPTREQMLADPGVADPRINRHLRLPRLPATVVALANEITRNARTPLDRALAIQAYLRDPENFTYDLSVSSGTGTSAIVDFLRDRRGYCEQFASTMAVLARVVGIPARVNVGFTSGELQEDGSLLVTAHDAHAWPELYFPGVGWSRFEPTPAAASSGPSVPLWLASTAVTGTPDGPTPATNTPSTASPSPTPSTPTGCAGAQRARPECRDVGEPLGASPTQHSAAPLVLLAILLAGLVGAVPAAIREAAGWRRWARARDAAGRAEAAWAQLRDDATDLGYGWSDAQTPRQAADRLGVHGRLSGESARALARVIRAVEYARYAPASIGWSGHPASDPRHDVQVVRAALAAGVSRRTRMRAKLLPSSSLRLLGCTVGRTVEALDTLETSASRLRKRLRTRLVSSRH